MAFSILSKRMLENDDIKRIVRTIKGYRTIFTLDQKRNFRLEFDILTDITLKEYDSIKKTGFRYQPGPEKITSEFYDYGYILPIIRFEEIKSSSQMISEDNNIITIQYGRGLTSPIPSASSITPTFLGFRKWSITFSL